MTTKAIDQAYQEATQSWTGADWTHEYRKISGADEADLEQDREENGEMPAYCEGHLLTCATCRAAERDARLAEEAAERAIKWVEVGEMENALEAAEEAASIERGWGDDPTWRPLVEAIEAAIEKAAAL